MNKPILLFAAAVIIASCGSQGEEAAGDAPAAAVAGSAAGGEAACDEQATEAQCVCPDDYLGQPPERPATGEPAGCDECPADCECKGGTRPCERKTAAPPDAPR